MSSKYWNNPPVVGVGEHIETPARDHWSFSQLVSSFTTLLKYLTCKNSWSQIPCRVDSVATVESKAYSNCKNCESNKEWDHMLADLVQNYQLFAIFVSYLQDVPKKRSKDLKFKFFGHPVPSCCSCQWWRRCRGGGGWWPPPGPGLPPGVWGGDWGMFRRLLLCQEWLCIHLGHAHTFIRKLLKLTQIQNLLMALKHPPNWIFAIKLFPF